MGRRTKDLREEEEGSEGRRSRAQSLTCLKVLLRK